MEDTLDSASNISNTAYSPYVYNSNGILNQISNPTTLNTYMHRIDDTSERVKLIWDSITNPDLPVISDEELLKILDMIKSKDDREALILGFRLLQGHSIPKDDFITQLIMKDACEKLVRVLHEDYS